MSKIRNHFLCATNVCVPTPKNSNHGAFIDTKQHFVSSNTSDTRFDSQNVSSAHAEHRAVKLAIQSRQRLKGARCLRGPCNERWQLWI